MKEKHTPGPWTIRETATHVTVTGADNETLFHDDKRLPRVCNDARLIAAAPDLLDALKLMVSHWPHWAANMDMKRIDFDAVSAARAAIRKALGELA